MIYDDLGNKHVLNSKGDSFVKLDQSQQDFHSEVFVASDGLIYVEVCPEQCVARVQIGAPQPGDAKSQVYKLPQHCTVDYLNAYCLLCHNDQESYFFDFSFYAYLTLVSDNQYVNPAYLQPRRTARRLRSLEWPRLQPYLRAADGELQLGPDAYRLVGLQDAEIEEQAQRINEVRAASCRTTVARQTGPVGLSGLGLSSLDGGQRAGRGDAEPGAEGLERLVVQLQLRLSAVEDRVCALERENERLGGALTAAAGTGAAAAMAIARALGDAGK